MAVVDRRTLILSGLAAVPLAAGSLARAVSASETATAPRPTAGAFVAAGEDRRDRPRTVLGGLRLDLKVAPESSAEALLILEHTDHHAGGPPLHVHHDQDEWFYVVEGRYCLEIGGERFELGPGDSAFAPREVPHVWAHLGDGVGRLILAFQPAGQMDAFFDGLAAAGPAPSPEVMRPLFAAHGMTLLGPPLAAA